MKSVRQQKLGCATINNYVIISFMKIIDPVTGWFETVKVLTFDLDKVTSDNDKFIDKSYTSISQLFNNTRLSR